MDKLFGRNKDNEDTQKESVKHKKIAEKQIDKFFLKIIKKLLINLR